MEKIDYRKLRLAEDLGASVLNQVSYFLIEFDNAGKRTSPTHLETAEYLNRLAFKGEIRHYRLRGEHGEIILFNKDEIFEDLDVCAVEMKKSPNVIKIQCYDEKVTHKDNVPIEISRIEELFKLPETLFNSGTCVYFLCRENKVVYVGQAQNVHSRLVEHMRDKVFDAVFYIRVPAQRMNKIESALIGYLNPEYNKTALSTNNSKISLAKSILLND